MVRIAKITYWLAGKLSRIETERPVYTTEGEPAGTRRMPCRLSMKMLGWSMRLDREHWDHWALQHKECDGRRCKKCKGFIDAH